MKQTFILRSDEKQIQPGDDYLCLARHSALAEKLIHRARHKGAKRCFSWHQFSPAWHQHLMFDTALRNSFIDDYYGKHSPLNIITITGTNGKTSTTCLIQRALEIRGYKAFLMGTIGLRQTSSSPWKHTGLTTPDYADIRASCVFAYKNAMPFMVMEASSHALAQNRLGSLSFLAVGSTAITFDDHLDFHKTNHHYLRSKARLFSFYQSTLKVLDYQNPMLPLLSVPVKTYYPKMLKNLALKTCLQSKNIQLAQELLSGLSLAPPQNLNLWVDSSAIKGRFEIFHWKNERTALVDFAHTPEALSHLLKGLQHTHATAIWLVFGCGGDRDRTKRYEMVRVGQSYAHQLIITADNPRHEPFEQIVEDMCSGVGKNKFIIIEERAAAIEYAHQYAPPGSLIIIAGKGHEEVQVIGSRSYNYSDLKEVCRYVEYS